MAGCGEKRGKMSSVAAGGWKFLQIEAGRAEGGGRALDSLGRLPEGPLDPTTDGNLGMFGKPRKFLSPAAKRPVDPSFSE